MARAEANCALPSSSSCTHDLKQRTLVPIVHRCITLARKYQTCSIICRHASKARVRWRSRHMRSSPAARCRFLYATACFSAASID
eukprot:7380399-Prymnesium_polylepis.2